jgi:hypothetical protein
VTGLEAAATGLEAAFAPAHEAGLSVRIVPLGAWGAARLLAEYDRARRTIAIDAGAVAQVRALRGEAAAIRFVACAVWHELHHHHFPGAGEAAAHAYAFERCSDDPRTFAALLKVGVDS